MIRNRFEKARIPEVRHEETGLWPQEFRLDG